MPKKWEILQFTLNYLLPLNYLIPMIIKNWFCKNMNYRIVILSEISTDSSFSYRRIIGIMCNELIDYYNA